MNACYKCREVKNYAHYGQRVGGDGGALAGGSYSLGELAAAVDEGLGWSKNTLATYLKRMAAKGLVKIERGAPKPYSAAVERDDCARAEREALLNRVYNGAAASLSPRS